MSERIQKLTVEYRASLARLSETQRARGECDRKPVFDWPEWSKLRSAEVAAEVSYDYCAHRLAQAVVCVAPESECDAWERDAALAALRADLARLAQEVEYLHAEAERDATLARTEKAEAGLLRNAVECWQREAGSAQADADAALARTEKAEAALAVLRAGLARVTQERDALRKRIVPDPVPDAEPADAPGGSNAEGA